MARVAGAALFLACILACLQFASYDAAALVRSVKSSDRPGTHGVQCETSQGRLRFQLLPESTPQGVQRFVDMVRAGFFTDIAMFRCIDGFLAQFGISDDADANRQFEKVIPDDGEEGQSFEKQRPGLADQQLFVTLADQTGNLGHRPWERPVAKLVEGKDVLDRLYRGYGERPDQGMIFRYGNSYLQQSFPKLDYIHSCELL
eukprot:CAMPEP_0206491902 /NCGR_PEP_ID=MMETSP0324_2-20121206/45529_1 /ASSEMBLY_ACC=CAM_ASM_000836 /TAXON_ID=2866 /ORGANISM="Crypthecodinium cohnii, Strain Seligo" /LENGTH=201 /DNA_ID=CAMNT_0053973695 /DNA_START=116 /DNA_END=722 /DNA_ORIENTATION=+